MATVDQVYYLVLGHGDVVRTPRLVLATVLVLVAVIAVITLLHVQILAIATHDKTEAKAKTHVEAIAEKRVGGSKARLDITVTRTVKAEVKILGPNGQVLAEADPVTLNLLRIIALTTLWTGDVEVDVAPVDENGTPITADCSHWSCLLQTGKSAFIIELGNGTGTASPGDIKLFNKTITLPITDVVVDSNATHHAYIFIAVFTPSENTTVSEVGLAVYSKLGTPVLLTHAVFSPVNLAAGTNYTIVVTLLFPRDPYKAFLDLLDEVVLPGYITRYVRTFQIKLYMNDTVVGAVEPIWKTIFSIANGTCVRYLIAVPGGTTFNKIGYYIYLLTSTVSFASESYMTLPENFTARATAGINTALVQITTCLRAS